MSKHVTRTGNDIYDFRHMVKRVIDQELATLPDLIKELPAEQRINVVLKLMPFVVPKVNKVDPDFDDWVEM